MQYLEPRTDVPAKDDWSTGLIMQELGMIRLALSILGLVAGAGLVGCLFLPMTMGNVAAIVVLSLLALIGAIGPLMHKVETLPLRRGLLDGPWQRTEAAVVLSPDDKYAHYIRLADGVVIEGFLEDMPDMVRARRELFICGPNANGKAVVRVAGFAQTANAKVAKNADYLEPEPEEPHEIGRPYDDPAVQKAFHSLAAGVHAKAASVAVAVVGGVIVLMSLWPIAPAGLVVGGLILAIALLTLPSMIEMGRWYADAVTALLKSEQWSPVPVTLFPWKPGSHVAGLATMEGGRLALVQFVDPNLHVIANIADTGVMWIAGSHEDVITVGVPRLPVLTVAAVQPDSDTPKEEPLPWIQRLRQPDFSGLPR